MRSAPSSPARYGVEARPTGPDTLEVSHSNFAFGAWVARTWRPFSGLFAPVFNPFPLEVAS